ncbi:MAG: hypothetical protein HY280_09160 [Nitrospinae bacterium]|nr:hypothetical protein [Nitrospinota bacterium]
MTTDEASDVSAVVIVAGPLKSFLEPEKKKIDAFIRGGGKVLFLTGSFSAQILGPWLEKYGVTLDNDVIVDRASRIMGGDILAPMVTTYEQHPITNGFKLMTFFPLASSLRVKNGVAGVTAVELAKTRTDTWGETDEAGLKKGVVQFDEGKDFQGPLAVAVVAEVASPAQDKEGKPVKGAVVVVADSEFASNSFLNVSGNKDLFMNIVNWLSSEEDRVTISSHNSDSEPLIFKSSQLSWMVAISVLGIPAMVFLAGLWANLRRRRNS